MVPEDAIVTNEKSTILITAFNRTKKQLNQINEVVRLSANSKSFNTSDQKLIWKEILRIAVESVLMFKHKYFLIFYLFNLLLSISLTIILMNIVKGKYSGSLILLITSISLCVLFFVFLYPYLIFVIVNIKNNQSVKTGYCILRVLNLLPKVLMVDFVVAVCVTLGVILLLFPGVTLFIYFIFVNQIIVIENTTIIDTLKKVF